MIDGARRGAQLPVGVGTEFFTGGPPQQEQAMQKDMEMLLQQAPSSATAGKTKPARKSNPTLDSIIKKADHDVALWRHRNDRFQEHQEKVELIEPLDVPDDEDALVLNDPLVILQKITGMVSKQPITREYRPRRPDLKESAQAGENAILRFDREREDRWSDEELHAPMFYEEFQTMLLRGWACARVGFNSRDAAEFDGDPYEYYPWDIYLADPANVYTNSTQKYTRVTHRFKTSVAELLDSAEFEGMDKALHDLDEEDEIEVTGVYEFNKRWDYHCVYVSQGSDQRWLKKPQAVGYMPWVIGLGGGFFFRDTPWGGDKSSYTKFIGMGILHTIDLNQKYLNKYVSMMATMVGDSANPFTALFSDNDEDTVPEGGFKRGGSAKYERAGKLEQLTKEKDLQAVLPLMSLLQDRQDRGTIPRTLYGVTSEGQVASGFMASLLMTAAQDIVFPFIRAWELFRRRLYRKALQVFENFAPLETPFMVMLPKNAKNPNYTWTEFYPMDVTEQGTDIDVSVDPMTIQDRINLGQLAVMLVEKNIISRDTARGADYLRTQDPMLEDYKIIVELAKLNPKVIEMLIPLIGAQTGQDTLVAVFQMAMQQINQEKMMGPQGPQGGGGQPNPSPQLPPSARPSTDNQFAQINQRGRPAQAAAAGGGGAGGVPPPSPRTNQRQPL